MDGIICGTCSREIEDDRDIYTCISCGGIMCREDYESTFGFCRNCSTNGPYHEC